ncbi:hypothetical protein AnigIFM60653_010807 [Aspergillus niger]|nr:hypothetical protein AnigIFM50267_010584 [Aspergillus niger]GLA09003.1 hypothetical protein AnigIFM60653_010807 [Aspergillus niger]
MRIVLEASLVVALIASAHAQGQRPFGSSFGVPGTNATFDYIVVGGGTAGLTLATRLAEQQNGSVAVIEAGGFYEVNNGNLSQVPASASTYSGPSPSDWQPLIDWGYVTTPQEGLYDAQVHYTRGKCLGGSSARNSMVFHRATKGAYQKWADAVNDDSFTFDNLLPFFEKSLHFTPPDQSLRLANATPWYDASVLGTGTGPLSVTYSHYAQAFTSWGLQGLNSAGLSMIPGFQSGSLLGLGYPLQTINASTMLRESSETAFLTRGLSHPNYQVYQSARAKRILFDGDRRATSVVVETEGFTYQLNATQEIILSAGTFGSPQLLMVSGVGPAAILNPLGIPVVADRAGVGQNLQDQLRSTVVHPVNVVTASAMNSPEAQAQAARQFDELAAGPYTSPGNDALAWEKIPDDLRAQFSNDTQEVLAQYPSDWPEIEYVLGASYIGGMEDATQEPDDGLNYASIGFAIGAPQSRGNLTITSGDAAVPPLINPNWLTESADIEVMVAGVKRARQFWQSSGLSPVVIGPEAFPGDSVETDREIEASIRRNAMSVSHASCTCAMGTPDDPMAVVDTQGRVYGVQGLRVVDASIFPLLPPGHPQATIYALAEKIACDITGHCDK